LGAIHPKLMWEFGRAVRNGGHRLVVTPEAEHQLRPLVRIMLERAPAIPGWEFYEYRLAEDLESTQQTVECRTGVDVSEFKARVSRGDQQRIDVVFTSPTVADVEDAPANEAAFVATETLLGEHCLNNWVGTIGVSPMTRGKGPKSQFSGAKE